MATAGSYTKADVTTIAGNRITVQGHTLTTAVSAATVAAAVMADADLDVTIVGDIHGFLRFPLADPMTFDGMLLPSDLRTSQIKLTQAAAGGVLALLAEEVYAY